MMKRERLFVKHQNTSNSEEFAVSNADHSIDCTNEPSAYEIFLLKKKEWSNIKSNLDERKMKEPILAGRTEENSNVSASNIYSRNTDEFDKDEMNETGKKQKLTKKESRKGINRKRKPVDKRELNVPAKTQRPTLIAKDDRNISVFSCLLKKSGDLEEMEDLLGQKMSDKILQNSGKKRKKKLQKKIQKIIPDGKIDDHLNKGKKAEKNGFNSKDEKFNETNENDKKFGLHEEMKIYCSLVDDEEEGSENDTIYKNFVKCNRTDKNEDAYSVVIDFEQKPFSADGDSVQNGIDAFQWLIHPYDIKQFFRSIFQKKVFHVCHDNANYYGNLFSTEKFIDILRTDYVEYGTNVNIAVYKNQQRSTLNSSGKVYPQKIQESIQAGCSVQFTNPQSFCDNVWYYCDLLQEVFGCFVGANTYITPANTAGFAPHWDDIDAFLLQLEGRKHWKVYAPIDDSELLPRLSSGNFTDSDVADRTLVFNDWLEQGDMLYIPRGFIHQGFADKDVHSLHLTVSVCRNVAYADLLERIIPPALSNFAEQHVNIRKSLPAGYLDMTGVLECAYPLLKTGAVKLHRFLDSVFSDFLKYIKELNESAIDMMAREFMRTALPPMLTKEEKDMTALCIAGSSLYGSKQHIITKDTSIKLLRRHGQRLIYESEERCFIVHRIANSRVYEGRPETLFDLDVELVEGFANLINVYPRWSLVSDLKCNTAADNIRLAQLLYNNGLLMAKFAKIVE